MKYAVRTLPAINVIGIALRTSNSDPASAIQNHWKRFFEANILRKIPNKADATIYSVYTNYAGDYTQPYTMVIGAKVTTIATVPEGMVSITIPAQQYALITAKGEMPNALVTAWQSIWTSDIKRNYKADFELYTPKFNNGQNSELDIYVGIQKPLSFWQKIALLITGA